MVGEDGVNIVPHKSDHCPVFIAELMHGCYEVLPLVCHNEINTAATDFWHQVFGHYSTRFCSKGMDI